MAKNDDQNQRNAAAQIAALEPKPRPLSPQELAALPGGPVEPSVGQMLGAFIEKGITSENVAAFERLIALRERMQDRDAEKDFAKAFADLQACLPMVNAVREVPNRDGTIRYCYAPYEEIMAQVRPLLTRFGFSISFSSDIKDARVIQTCTLQHTGGHKRTNQFMALIGSGPPGASGAQIDGAANTYAKRQALCDALNIVVNHDTDGVDDARDEGSPISFEQAETLKQMVKDTGSNEAAFLKFAGATKYEEIGSSRYQQLFNELNKKAKR